jgi:hypothetical protein
MGEQTNQRTVTLKRRKGESFGFSLQCANGKGIYEHSGKKSSWCLQMMVAGFSKRWTTRLCTKLCAL